MAGKSHVSRRTFLRSAAAAGAVAWTAKSYARVAGANDRLNMGVIGCGGMATGGHLGGLLRLRKEDNLEIIAVCDVWDKRAREYADKIKAAGGEAKVFKDYRELLAIKDLDYVMNATPEHQHAPITLAALDAGKHVYVEKPMTHTIEEGQAVVAKAKATGLKVQVGVQGMSDESYAKAHEAILAGKIGPVVEAQIDYVRCYVGPGPWRDGNIKEGDPKPADLDWEAWLGPAPRRPWSAPRYFEWRCYRDYSGGISTDLFVHRITRIIRACGLQFPSRVAGMGGIYLWDDGRDLPDNLELLAEYPAVEGITPGMTVRILGTMANDFGADHCIRGHKGTLIFTGKGWKIIERGSNKVVEEYTRTGAEDTYLHHKNHHAAIRDNAPLNCPPELGLAAVVTVCMGNQSWFEKKMISWNAEKNMMVSA